MFFSIKLLLSVTHRSGGLRLIALLTFMVPASSVAASERENVLSFIEQTSQGYGVWVRKKYVLHGLSKEQVFGRDIYDRGSPIVEEVDDIDWLQFFQSGPPPIRISPGGVSEPATPLPSRSTRGAVLNLISDGHLRANITQHPENAEERLRVIDVMREMDRNRMAIYMPPMGGYDPTSGFTLTLSLRSDMVQSDVRTSSDTSFLFNLGRIDSYRVISLEQDSRRSECDWNAVVRVWIDDPSTFGAALLRAANSDHLEFANCYAWGRDGLRWVYMSVRD